MKFRLLRGVALCALVPAALALGGCQDLSTAPGGNTGGIGADKSQGDPQEIAAVQQAIETDDYTTAGTVESDFELETSASPFGRGTEGARGDSLLFHRVVQQSTRTRTVTQTGEVATVTISEDRTGTLRLGRRGVGVQIERPFSDHGARTATLVKRGGRWSVTASTFLDRASTLVDAPVRIEYVEFTPRGGAGMRFNSATEVLGRDAWPTMPVEPVAITVKVEGAGDLGARVFFHDRYGEGAKEHHKMEFTRDALDATLYHGTWTPSPRDKAHERAWRRLLTIDVFDAATLSFDANASYNARQWVMPIAFRRGLNS